MCKKSNLFVYKFVVNCQVCKQLRQGVPYKAENWHTWSYEQYFSKHRFLDICRCVFNFAMLQKKEKSVIRQIFIFSSFSGGFSSSVIQLFLSYAFFPFVKQ